MLINVPMHGFSRNLALIFLAIPLAFFSMTAHALPGSCSKNIVYSPAEREGSFYGGSSDSAHPDANGLASYQADAWLDWIIGVIISGFDPHDYYNKMGTLVLNAPMKIKEMLISQISQNYHGLSKASRRIGFLPPRRSVDAVLSTLFDPYVYFLTAHSTPEAVLERYRGYVHWVQSSLFPGLKRPRFTADDVLSIAKKMQIVMQGKANDDFILIYGSFPGGRALFEDSDIDWGHSKSSPIPFKQVAAQVRPVLRQTETLRSLELSSVNTDFSLWDVDGASFPDARSEAMIQPLLVAIYPTEIRLVIFPSVEMKRPLFLKIATDH